MAIVGNELQQASEDQKAAVTEGGAVAAASPRLLNSRTKLESKRIKDLKKDEKAASKKTIELQQASEDQKAMKESAAARRLRRPRQVAKDDSIDATKVADRKENITVNNSTSPQQPPVKRNSRRPLALAPPCIN